MPIERDYIPRSRDLVYHVVKHAAARIWVLEGNLLHGTALEMHEHPTGTHIFVRCAHVSVRLASSKLFSRRIQCGLVRAGHESVLM